MPKYKPIKGVTCIKRNGTQYWYARVNGRRVYCGKGEEGRKLSEAARSKYVAKQYENREMNAGLKVKKADFRTVTDMANWYMQLPAMQEKKGYKRKIIASVHLLRFFGNKGINQIESDDLDHYRAFRKNQGIAGATVDVEISLLSTMYNLARKRKKIPADVVPGEFLRERNSLPRRKITDEEFKSLVKVADENFRDVLICGYESGMRSSEICDLRAYQVHLDVQHISGAIVDYIDLGEFDTKTGARRTVPVSEKLKDIIKRRLKDLESEGHVFTDEKGIPYNNDKICKRFARCCRRAGLPQGDKLRNEKGERIGLVFHCLRHTRTSTWVEMGFSDEIIRRATGHKSLEAYHKYIHLDASAVMRLVGNSKRHKKGIKSLQNPVMA